LGATYAIPVIYVPVLMITLVDAFYLLLRPQPKAFRPSPAMRRHLRTAAVPLARPGRTIEEHTQH
jgi:hypothetical protein